MATLAGLESDIYLILVSLRNDPLILGVSIWISRALGRGPSNLLVTDIHVDTALFAILVRLDTGSHLRTRSDTWNGEVQCAGKPQILRAIIRPLVGILGNLIVGSNSNTATGQSGNLQALGLGNGHTIGLQVTIGVTAILNTGWLVPIAAFEEGAVSLLIAGPLLVSNKVVDCLRTPTCEVPLTCLQTAAQQQRRSSKE